jgi:hypothetical protein
LGFNLSIVRSPPSIGSVLPLYSEGIVYKLVWVSVCCLCTGLLDAALSRREESIVPQTPPDEPVSVLALDRQGIPAVAQPPVG